MSLVDSGGHSEADGGHLLAGRRAKGQPGAQGGSQPHWALVLHRVSALPLPQGLEAVASVKVGLALGDKLAPLPSQGPKSKSSSPPPLGCPPPPEKLPQDDRGPGPWRGTLRGAGSAPWRR